MLRYILFLLVNYSLFLVFQVNAQENLGIYEEVSAYPCTTLADINGRIGCTSSRNGDVGSLWPIYTNEDIDSFVASPPSGKIVAVIKSQVFTRTNVEKLISTSKLSGIFHLPGEKPAQFSPVSKFPLQKYGLHSDSNYEWNPAGDDFAFQFYKIPMFSIYPSSVSAIMNKADENKMKNGGYPRWGAQLHDWMHSSENAEICLKRGQCQPLGGKSTLSSFEKWDENKEKIFVSSWLDSNSFFHDLAVGADGDISGVISILLAANALSKVDKSQFEKQIVFSLFQAESWGYIGSKKLIYDIKNFVCETVENNYCTKPFKESLEFKKLNLDKISAFIELQQVGNVNTNLFFHQETRGENDIIQQLRTQATSSNLTLSSAASTTPGIPPSSLNTFLLERPSIPGVVLAEFSEHYSTNYFHSEYDDSIKVESVCNVGTLLARTLYSLANATHNSPKDLTADCNFAATLVECFTKNMACSWATGYLGDVGDFNPQPTQYTSVYRQTSIFSIISKLVHDYLVEITGTVGGECESNSDCDGNDCVKGRCYTSATVYHDALSPAFNDDWELVNKEEPSWTESNWDAPYIELFLIDNPATEWVALIFGLLELVLSFIVVYFAQKYLAKRFKAA